MSQDFALDEQRALIQTKKKKKKGGGKTARGVTFSTNSLQKMSGHNKFNKMAVLCSGYMWNDPGSPWHAQTGGPLLCAYRFLYGGGKRQREDGYYAGKRKMLCWATKQKCLIHYFPFRARGSQEGRLSSCHGSGAS